MNLKKFPNLLSLLIVSAFALVLSCKDETERLTASDTQDISEEAVTDSYFQDMDDMASVAIETPSDTDYGQGRAKTTFEINDSRFKCTGSPITLTIEKASGSTVEHPQGVITVDYGTTGCTDANGNIRKGKLIFTYNGRRFEYGSTVITTPENYSVNDILLEGTRTLTNITGSTDLTPKFNAILVGGKATFPDNAQATRNSNITWQWVKSQTASENYLLIDQASTANGTTRGGRTYNVSLVKALKFKRFCGIAVEGIKKYIINGSKEVTIDYGDGTCDKSVTITVNGVTREVKVN
jgi:hypothetical protein